MLPWAKAAVAKTMEAATITGLSIQFSPLA
jgi:hypothetical protein